MTIIDASLQTIDSFEKWLDQHDSQEEATVNPVVVRALDSKEVCRILQQSSLHRNELLAWTHQVDVRLSRLVQKVQNGILDRSSSDAILLSYMERAEDLLAVRKQLVDQFSSIYILSEESESTNDNGII